MAGHGRDYTIWGLVLPIYLPTFIFAVSEGIAIPVVPLMVYHVFGSTEAMVGGCVAIVGLGKISSNLPSGRFIARHGNRRAMLVAQLSLLGATTAAAVAPSVFLLLISPRRNFIVAHSPGLCDFSHLYVLSDANFDHTQWASPLLAERNS